VATYHTAGVTHEARRNMAGISADQIVRCCAAIAPAAPDQSRGLAGLLKAVRNHLRATAGRSRLNGVHGTSDSTPGRHDMRRSIVKAFALAATAAVGLTHWAAHAAYPERPIKMIVAYSAGGATDVMARAMQPFLEKYLGGGAKIVVENRTGAGGAIGFGLLAGAPADGYTIGFINTPNLLTIPIERKTPFTWESFDLLGNVVDDPGNFAVHADSNIRSLDHLATHAKARPGQLTVGTTGVGSDDHLAMLYFERIAGVKMNHVPFKGAADVRAAGPRQADRRRGSEHRRIDAGDQGRCTVPQPGADERQAH
jgi:hypothetical protein